MPTYTVTWRDTATGVDTEARHIEADSPLVAGNAVLVAHGLTDTEITVTVRDEQTGRRDGFLIDDYARIALRLWACPEWFPPFTRADAVIVARGWATEDVYPRLCAWAYGHTGPVDELLTEARELWDNLCSNIDSWPYEGEPNPSIRAVAALTHYLEGHHDNNTTP